MDFTYSSLVALFFSCDGKGEEKFTISELIGDYSIDELEKDKRLQSTLIHNLISKNKKDNFSKYGQIYLIKKKRLINITDLILDLNGKNLFVAIQKDDTIKLKLEQKIIDFFNSLNKTEAKEHLANLKEQCEEIKKINEICFEDDLTSNDYVINDDTSVQLYGNKYFELLYNLIIYCQDFPAKYKITLDIYFTYTPPYLFPRLTNQKGMFIYQPYIYVNDRVYDYHELIMQEIVPDITIYVDKYKEILYELKMLGIDSGYVYNDIDNIAKTVKYEYEK